MRLRIPRAPERESPPPFAATITGGLKMTKKTKPADEPEPEKTDAPAGEDKPEVQGRASVTMPTRCRIIEFTDDHGDTAAAMVTEVKTHEDGRTSLQLAAFHPVMGVGNACVFDAVKSYRHKPTGEPGTWNWPPRS